MSTGRDVEAGGVQLRSEGLTWRELDGETVLLDLQGSVYLRANRTGTFLLKRLTEDCERDELVAHLARAYGLPVVQAATDVDEFLKQLADRKLLIGP